MKVEVTIEEVLSRTVTIDAVDEEDARERVIAKYRAQDIILDADDLASVQVATHVPSLGTSTSFTDI